MWLQNRFNTKRDLIILIAILAAGYIQFHLWKNYIFGGASSTYSTYEIVLISIIVLVSLIVTFYLFGKFGASSAYFKRNDMLVGRIPVGVSLFFLLVSAALLIFFTFQLFDDSNNWDLMSLVLFALIVVLMAGLPTYGIFSTFFYELSWNALEVYDNSISLRRNKPRHFYFQDISRFSFVSNGTKVFFKDGSHLLINQGMCGEKDLILAIKPFYTTETS